MTDSQQTESRILHVIAWEDPVVDVRGFRVEDPYVEMFWLPVLGPTATWLLRRMASGLESAPHGYNVGLDEMARTIGVAYSEGRHNPFGRALHRCVMFGAAQHVAVAPVRTLAVRRHLPMLPARHLARLPDQLRTAHSDWVSTWRSSATAH